MIETKKRINVSEELHIKLNDFINVLFPTVKNPMVQKEV
jgi:hypothetical protein